MSYIVTHESAVADRKLYSTSYQMVDLVQDLTQVRVTKQADRIINRQNTRALRRAGREGRKVLREIDLYVKGANAARRDDKSDAKPYTRVDIYAANALAGIPDATDTTKEFVNTVAFLQSGQMTDQDLARYRENLDKATITVNPRFGDLVRSEQPPVFFTIGQQTPNWIITPGSE